MTEPIAQNTDASHWPKWYWMVSYAAIAAIIALIGILALIGWMGEYGFVDRISIIIGPLVSLLIIFLVVWGSWVCPVLDAQDANPQWTCEPRRRKRSLLISIWTLPVMTWLLCVMMLAALPSELICIALFFAVLFTIISSTVGTSVSKNIRQTTMQRNLCFECGYDLRMTTSGNCPECGTVVPEADTNETSRDDM